ncbi:MAG: dephospho-CoA kinase [Candidatus Latescibacter sp.]|nr:dephospho-CoA kinase [Candidatus Latescibacter sp.]
MILGITGCPGSGKSVLAKVIASRGWMLIDADLVGREVVEEDGDMRRELARIFGRDILGKDGKLDRRLLARKAFATHENTLKLNRVVHPVLVRRITEKIRDERNAGTHAVVDCALIYEWGIEGLFDLVVCIRADESLRKKRLMERDGRSDEEVERMFSAQLPEPLKVLKADIVLSNNDKPESMVIYGLMLADLPRYFREGGCIFLRSAPETA